MNTCFCLLTVACIFSSNYPFFFGSLLPSHLCHQPHLSNECPQLMNEWMNSNGMNIREPRVENKDKNKRVWQNYSLPKLFCRVFVLLENATHSLPGMWWGDLFPLVSLKDIQYNLQSQNIRKSPVIRCDSRKVSEVTSVSRLMLTIVWMTGGTEVYCIQYPPRDKK